MKSTRTAKRFAALTGVFSVALTLANCSSNSSGSANGSTTLQYAMWDNTQVPAYQACADKFHAENPKITVKITQTAYASYWTTLNTGFVAGTAPDVFVDVTSYYPDFVKNKEIENLSPLIARDKVDMSLYQLGTGTDWIDNGGVYGLQKDLDGIGLVYNPAAAAKAGVSAAALQSVTWNPTDGGSYEQLIKKLTVDTSGRNGLNPAFDKNSVKTYGSAAPDSGNVIGQQDWGNLAAEAGAKLIDKNPFGTRYGFDDPALVKTVGWYQKMIADGYMMNPDKVGGLGNKALFETGKIATATAGSWTASDLGTASVSLKWATFPRGPQGVKVYSNSIADSINAGSKNQAVAWSWVKYLGTDECQSLVAAKGVVFPALKSATAKADVAYKSKGINLSPILAEIQNPDSKLSIPVSDNYQQISQLAGPALQSIWLGAADPATALSGLNKQVNALFK